MNLQAIALVQGSMAQVMGEQETAVSLFYAHLATLDPARCELFTCGAEPQKPSGLSPPFFAFLQQWVDSLDAPQTIIPAVKRLGRLHARRGVQPAHYDAIAQALFHTLAEIHRSAYTPQLADAWSEAFYLLIGLLKEAAATH
jgi:hemoglobin-like flavoprotein